MANTNRLVLILLGLLLLGGVLWYGYWFSQNFEQRTHEVRVDVSPEARRNQFLAAEGFLQQAGQTVSSQRSRDIFTLQPGPNDTIFLGNHAVLFLERNHDALWEWIEQGGHLIYVAYDRDDEEVPLELLDELGVEMVRLSEDDTDIHCNDGVEPCAEPAAEEADGEPGGYDAVRRIAVDFQSSEPGDHLARFRADRHLSDTKEWADVALGDEWMPNLLQYPLGDGRVTVLSDNELFQNEQIGEKDQAYLLSRLVNHSDKVWLFYSADMPSLMEQLWQRTPYLLLLSMLLLLIAGWRMLLRSGPNLQNRFDERRNLLEHIDASAQFSWRIDRAQQLFQANRETIEQGWRRRHPQLNGLEQAERCEWIAEKSGIVATAIERSLYGEISSEQDFIRASSVLQKLAAQVKPATTHNE
jgi:hypothetical protein